MKVTEFTEMQPCYYSLLFAGAWTRELPEQDPNYKAATHFARVYGKWYRVFQVFL